MIVCKQGEDVHTNIWSQIVCHRLMTEYDFDAHLERLRDIYRKKYAVLQKAMQEHLAPYITWNEIEGGLFVWCRLPDGVDMPDFCKQAVLRKVCVVPGNAFLTDENEPCQAFRINYSTPTDEQLVRGVAILGQLIPRIFSRNEALIMENNTTVQTQRKPVIFSAIQPSGSITLGNYLGALKTGLPCRTDMMPFMHWPICTPSPCVRTRPRSAKTPTTPMPCCWPWVSI